MNIQQLEYIIAVDNYRHFSKAAEASFVTQPTLSMMIQKLEDELGVKIFDRTQLPVQPTEIGKKNYRSGTSLDCPDQSDQGDYPGGEGDNQGDLPARHNTHGVALSVAEADG